VACAAHCDRSGAGTHDKPKRVAVQALPECAALCGGDGRVAFTREGRQFRGVVCGILFCGGELRLAEAAVLHVIELRLQIGGGNLGGGSVGEILLARWCGERGGFETW
jgi:hypothetical protein